MSAYPRVQPPTVPVSPAEVERRRFEEAERRMSTFCLDLNELVGRRMPDRDGVADDLTRRIYAAALEAGVPLEDDTSWMTAAAPVLKHMRSQVDAAIYARICAAWTGELPNLGDVARALEYAKGYFEVGEPEPDLILDLATCLLDYAFCSPREQPSRSLMFPQTATDGGFAVAVRQEMVVLEQRRDRAAAVRENRSLQQLGTSLRLAGTVGLGAAWFLTGQHVFLPLIAVLWLMTWMLVSRKLLAVEPEPEPADLLEEALDRLEDQPASTSAVITVEEPKGWGPVWPFVAPKVLERPRIDGCSICGGSGLYAGTYQGRSVCSECAEQLR